MPFKELSHKEGYFQKEIKKVLDISDQKPEGAIFIVPLRLEDCEPPRRLAKWQYVDYFPNENRDRAFARLLRSLKVRGNSLGLEFKQFVTDVEWAKVESGLEQVGIESQQSRKKSHDEKIIPPQVKPRKIASQSHGADHHTALVSEIVSQASANGVNFVIAKLQWGKDDIGYGLHVEPTSYSSAGMQTTDFLAYLGFKRESCSFIPHGQCYSTWIEPEFELSSFTEKFDEAFGFFEKGANMLQSCGHFLDQPEGWGYFLGKDSSRKINTSRFGYRVDGHTAIKSENLKKAEDENFFYQMSWIVTTNEKGWVFHYRVKDTANPQVIAAFRFLRLPKFGECPYFNFEECYWIFFQRGNNNDSFINGTASIVHGNFGAHEKNFSPALRMQVQANDLMSPFGFHFLSP